MAGACQQRPLVGNVPLRRLADHPRERHLFLFGNSFEGFVKLRWETDCRTYRRLALGLARSCSLLSLHNRFTAFHHIGEAKDKPARRINPRWELILSGRFRQAETGFPVERLDDFGGQEPAPMSRRVTVPPCGWPPSADTR